MVYLAFPLGRDRTGKQRYLRWTYRQLADEVSGGAEVPFELMEQGRSSAPLYCYRPLTEDFIRDRARAFERQGKAGEAVVLQVEHHVVPVRQADDEREEPGDTGTRRRSARR